MKTPVKLAPQEIFTPLTAQYRSYGLLMVCFCAISQAPSLSATVLSQLSRNLVLRLYSLFLPDED